MAEESPVTPVQENEAETPSELATEQTDLTTQPQEASGEETTPVAGSGEQEDAVDAGATTEDQGSTTLGDETEQIELPKEEEESTKEEADTKIEETTTENNANAEPPKDGESKDEISPVSSTAQVPDGEPETATVPDIDRTAGEADMFEPTQLDNIAEEEEELRDEDDAFNREEAIEHYKVLYAETERIQSKHDQLQHRIAEILARRKLDDHQDPSQRTDHEQKYQLYIECIGTLKEESDLYKKQFEEAEKQLKRQCLLKQAKVDRIKNKFAEFVREKSLTAVHTRTGKKLSSQEVNQYFSTLEKKNHEVTQVRLENLKLQHKINKQEMLIKEKEQLAEGLHMIDFEQLRINNVDLNEKIEERNEEIQKLTSKVTSTVQVLAHLKEKLQFVQAERSEKELALRKIDEKVAKKRDLLTKLKQAKDAIRNENIHLKKQGGLVGHKTLLRDLEAKYDENAAMCNRLEDLTRKHSELTLECDALKKKIDETRTLHI